MNISKEEYSQMTKDASPKSKTPTNCVKAFFIGGAICTLGQLLTNTYCSIGLEIKDARTITSISLIFLGALLTTLGVYDKVAKHAGAGTLVPITGFANAVVSPAIEFKTEGFILGVGAKMFVISGPVIVYGVSVSVLWGVVYFLFFLNK